MVSLDVSRDFFNPSECTERINIIGCGAIGSTVAELLVRSGLTNIVLFDFDIVEAKNVANQMFRNIDIGKPKVDALVDILSDIDPEIRNKIRTVPAGYTGQQLAGYVFLCVDSIDVRKEIVEKYKDSPYIKAMFDFRMRMTDAQHYAADWSDKKMIQNFINSMQFTKEEAEASTPVSACNITLSLAPTVRTIVAYGVSNFMNFVKGGADNLKKMILIDAFSYQVNAI